LRDGGVPQEQATWVSLIAGGIVGSLESVGRIPVLKQLNAGLFGQFKKQAGNELAKATWKEGLKRFGVNVTKSQLAEISTEMAQEIVGNAAKAIFDENTRLT